MSGADRSRVRSLFDRLADLPDDRRRAVLDDECGDDAALRAEVESLLEADGTDGGFLDGRPVLDGCSGAALADRVFGRYRIVREIGHGGASTVYEAFQDDPPRPVALKVLRFPVPVEAHVARFRREAALLARLEHPGIVVIHDTGSLEIGGQEYPYLALELVGDAQPITEFARARDLSTEARLRLFVELCDAVAAAHRHGVVHRDLKPGNVLVDRDGRVRVIDFGIARVLQTESVGGAARTVTGQLVGTPRYMSPEQLTGSREIDVRTDVWSLGLVLFELLTGGFPFDVDDVPVTAIADVVTSREPASMARFDPELRGDLDIVVARALAVDVDGRYPDASALGSEIERVLAGRPIEARRDHLLYVLRKRVARNRLVLAASAVVVVLAAASAVGLGVLWRRAEDARNEQARSLYASRLAIAANSFEAFRLEEARRTLEECEPELRCWAWSHLRARIDDSTWRRRVLDDYVRALCPSPDGSRLLVFGDRTCRVLDAASGAPVAEWLAHDHAVTGAALLPPDGRELATVSWDRTLRLWDVESMRELGRVELPEQVWSVAVDPGGTWIATGDRGGWVRIWDRATRALEHEVRAHPGGVTALAASRDGTALASGGTDRTVCLLDPDAGTLRLRIAESAARARAGTMRVPAHGAPVAGLVFDASGDFLFSVSSDGVAKMWNAASGQLEFFEVLEQRAGQLALSPDGRTLAAGCKDAVLLRSTVDARPGEPLRADARTLTTVAFLPGGERLVAGGSDGFVRCFELERRSGAYSFDRHAGECYALDRSADGSWLGTADDRGHVRIYDTRVLDVAHAWRVDHHRIRSVVLDDDGDRVWTSSDDRTIRRWDPATATVLATAGGPGRPRLWRNGERLLVTGDSPVLAILDADSLAPRSEIRTPDGALSAASPSPSGELVATGSSSGWIRVWRLGDAAPVGAWQAHAGATWVVRWDGENRLLSGGSDDALRAWSGFDGTCVREYARFKEPVVDAVPAGDGRLLVCRMRGNPCVIAVDSGSTLLELTGHEPNAILRGLVPIGDGRYVTGDDRGILRVWSGTPDYRR